MTQPVIESDIAVIGGGIAGLTTAYRLARAGLGVSVIEESAHWGGLVSSHRVAGISLDRGADSFATRGSIVADLAAELGLECEEPIALPARVLSGGTLVELPRHAVMGIPTDLRDESMRAALSSAGLARAREDLTMAVEGMTAQATLAQLVTARMGKAVLETYVRPIVRGVHSCEPEDILASRVLGPWLENLQRAGSLAGALEAKRTGKVAGSAVAHLKAGMGALGGALADAAKEHSATLLGGRRAVELRPEDAGWRITISSGLEVGAGAGRGAQKASVVAKHVVIAAPPPWTFAAAGSAIPPSLKRGGTPTSADLLTVVAKADAIGEHRRAGVLVADPAGRAKALTYLSAKWPSVREAVGPDRVAVRLSYPPGVIRPGEADEHLEFARCDAARLLGQDRPWPKRAVIGLAHVRLPRPAPIATDVDLENGGLPRGVSAIGEWKVSAGIAGVVADATRVAEQLIGDWSD